ncbi:di-trans,poly-cis-decaprenylcistransferase [Hansschlegelia sp.]|uniref:di-trans,poly-cis-decaprenylcistransferase n=1 Tax=Hansschlegelia sp. TaxID=2041892 RepID=UPI002C819370|nr:di-trans,poly-cis-decaprenylcistransferase [Hansschlegelia sp.]HVI29963.1 di-trans,poly-cis-decaprenylcistransferase [Hansschlegelia sp.]
MQSTLHNNIHLAIIMDGNGRWALRRGWPRAAGHRAGVRTVRRLVKAAPDCGVGVLTLYAFSSDNWRRPAAEVAALMELLRRYVSAEAPRLAEAGVRLTAIGRRDRVPTGLADAIAAAEARTLGGERLHLRIALDYSARDAILLAAAKLAGVPDVGREVFGRHVTGGQALPDVDLLIRTGGERRLSDFLLWESAYAELWFTDRLWPDFDQDDLRAALADFRARERRFGGLSTAAAA